MREINERANEFMDYLRDDRDEDFHIGSWTVFKVVRDGITFVYGHDRRNEEVDRILDPLDMVGLYNPATGVFYSNEHDFSDIDARIGVCMQHIAEDAAWKIHETIGDEPVPMQLEAYEQKLFDELVHIGEYERRRAAILRIAHGDTAWKRYDVPSKNIDVSGNNVVRALKYYDDVIRELVSAYIAANAFNINLHILRECEIQKEIAELSKDLPAAAICMRKIVEAVSPLEAKQLTMTIAHNDGEVTVKMGKQSLLFYRDMGVSTYQLTNRESEALKNLYGESYPTIQPEDIKAISFRGKVVYGKS